MEELKKP